MDISSKIIENNELDEEKGIEKLSSWIRKYKKFKNICFILLGIIFVLMMIFIPNKKLVITIGLFTFMIILSIKKIAQDIKDIAIFQEIYEITHLSEDVVDIFERTNKENGMEPILGKNHKSIKEELYKVEKIMYSSILKGKQSENLSNELVVEVSKKLKKPVEKIKKHIKDLENSNEENYHLIINELEKESSMLKHNIEELFELAKVVNKSIDLNLENIDIENVIRQALVEYEDKLKEKNLNLIYNKSVKKPIVKIDGNQMWRVFEIILDNIVNYSKENSRVYVNVYEEDKKIGISMINISKDELNIDIETFFKNIREDEKNNKMGLAIGSNLINAQGGNLDLFIDGDMFKIDIKLDAIKESEE
ncbi:sensor histidine kinase [Romboutsia sp.]|uniref:sensor histidine kinase n=1 Tax=Romboutsia sp. TaxID=1965302 RepID=UPI003F2EC8A5